MASSTALKSILIGTPVFLRGTFRDSSGALADPVSLTYTVKKPDDSEQVYTNPAITQVSTGVWQIQIPTDQVGQWWVNLAGAGNDCDVDNEASFLVRARRT